MTMTASAGSVSEDEWRVLGRHDWDGNEELVTTLVASLAELDGIDGIDDVILYEYVDTEAMSEFFESGGTEARFEYQGYEIRVALDGTVAAR